MATAPIVLNERYEVGPLIAEGGMAQVFHGHDLRLDRAVAIKVLRAPYVASEEFVARFAREARLAASLTDPHLVQVFDVGRDGDRHYIVMERLPGHTLKDLAGHAPVPLEQAVDLVRQVALGMAAAHRRGLVHRDLTPQNILLTEEGNAKVGDFGLAQLGDASPLTMPGTIWGTVAYLSPEQAQGLRADARSDVYALGAIFYELLTGVPPYTGASQTSILLQHITAPPPRLRDHNSALPVAAETIVVRALAKAPDERFPSMAAFAQALAALEAGEDRRSARGAETSVWPVMAPPAVPSRPSIRAAAATQVIRSHPESRRAAPPPTTHPPAGQPAPAPNWAGLRPAARPRGRLPVLPAAVALACVAVLVAGVGLARLVRPAASQIETWLAHAVEPVAGPTTPGLAKSTPPAATVSNGAAAIATRPAVVETPVATTTVATSATVAITPTAPVAATATTAPAAATSATPLTLGTAARVGGVSLAVARYSWSSTCPDGRGRPTPGTKVVVLQIVGRNDRAGPLTMPAVQWTLAGQPATSGGSGAPCPFDQPAFENACPPAGPLAAGGRCDGWLLFEVPQALDVSGAIVQVRAPAPASGGSAADTASWRLPG